MDSSPNPKPKRAHEGTLQWVAEDPQYRQWFQSHSGGLLRVTGDAVCGKSVISRYLAGEDIIPRSCTDAGKSKPRACRYHCSSSITTDALCHLLRDLVSQLSDASVEMQSSLAQDVERLDYGVQDDCEQLW